MSKKAGVLLGYAVDQSENEQIVDLVRGKTYYLTSGAGVTVTGSALIVFVSYLVSYLVSCLLYL